MHLHVLTLSPPPPPPPPPLFSLNAQNENGPCPLLALCNVLILSGKIKIAPGQTDISSTHLTDLLGTHLFESYRDSQLSDGEKANLEQNIQDTMAIFPKLQTGLDVNVKFNRCVVNSSQIDYDLAKDLTPNA